MCLSILLSLSLSVANECPRRGNIHSFIQFHPNTRKASTFSRVFIKLVCGSRMKEPWFNLVQSSSQKIHFAHTHTRRMGKMWMSCVFVVSYDNTRSHKTKESGLCSSGILLCICIFLVSLLFRIGWMVVITCNGPYPTKNEKIIYNKTAHRLENANANL